MTTTRVGLAPLRLGQSRDSVFLTSLIQLLSLSDRVTTMELGSCSERLRMSSKPRIIFLSRLGVKPQRLDVRRVRSFGDDEPFDGVRLDLFAAGQRM